MKGGLYFFSAVIAFMGGVLLRSFVDLGVWHVAFLVILAVAIIFLKLGGGIYKNNFSPWQGASEFLLLVMIIIIAGAVGIFRFSMVDPEKHSDEFINAVQQKAEFLGYIVDEPDVREAHQLITVRPRDYKSTKILLITELYPELNYGDVLSIKGELNEPESFATDTGRVFDYPNFLAKDGIYYQMFYPDVEPVSGEQAGGSLKIILFGLKNAFMENVRLMVPEPHTSLLGGLLLGIKQSLGSDLLDDFRAVGLIHIVVLSGYNITIIADFIGRLLSRLGSLRVRLILSAIAVVLFVVLTGASATIVRAGAMALLVLLARAIGRNYNMTRALFLAALIMIMYNPMILAFDPSFQLSFLATFSLIVLAPMIEKKLHWVSERWQLRETLTATISTQIFVLPLLLYMTGQFSLASLPVNLLVLMIIPATMLVGFIAGVLSWIHFIVALPFAWLVYFLLEYQLIVVDLFASFSWATVQIGYFPFWGTILGYVLLGLLILFKKFRDTSSYTHPMRIK